MASKRRRDEDETADAAAAAAAAAARPAPAVSEAAEAPAAAPAATDGNAAAAWNDGNGDDDDDDDAVTAVGAARRLSSRRSERREAQAVMGKNCPYMDTIRRPMLDFDFEKLCSVSLSDHNVYACLVCGKYFQGRGPTSYAYLHSVDAGHHVFANLRTLKVYCLPDDYEIIDSSLDDIRFYIKPRFTKEEIASLDKVVKVAHDLNNKPYMPGFIGLNNVKANDYFNVVIQALAHVPALRNYFLDESNYAHLTRSPVVHAFGELVRKMWSPGLFKGHVSPHELLQAVSTASKKRFTTSVQSDARDFLTWFLNELHFDLGGTKAPGSSAIVRAFQGMVEVKTSKLRIINQDTAQQQHVLSDEAPTKEVTPYLFLVLNLPPPPLFKDELDRNIIPQVPLATLLNQFDGQSVQVDTRKAVQRSYRIKKLPPYLILIMQRFSKNNWTLEKNPTIINFPIKNVDLGEYLDTGKPHDPNAESLATRYDLLANITHEGLPGPGKGVYKIHLLNKAKEQWLEIQDLFVEERSPQMIFLSESYIQIWERKDVAGTLVL